MAYMVGCSNGLKRHVLGLQATREQFTEYINVLKKAMRDAAEASAAHSAGIALLPPEGGEASSIPHAGDHA